MKKVKVLLMFVLMVFAVSLSSVAYAWTWDATNWIGGSNGDSTWSFGFGTSYAAKGSTVQETISNTTTVIHNNIYQLNTNLRNGLNAIVNNTYKMNSNIQGATNFISGRLEQLFDVLVALDGNTDMVESYLQRIENDTMDIYGMSLDLEDISDKLTTISSKLDNIGGADLSGYYTDIDLNFDSVLDALDNLTVTVDLDTSDIARALYIGADGKHDFSRTVLDGIHDWQSVPGGAHDWEPDGGGSHTWQEQSGGAHAWSEPSYGSHTWQPVAGGAHDWELTAEGEHEWENTSRLPAGYTELEYIQSSGTQYVNTGVKPTLTTAGSVCLSTLSNVSGYDVIMSAQSRDTNNDVVTDAFCLRIRDGGINLVYGIYRPSKAVFVSCPHGNIADIEYSNYSLLVDGVKSTYSTSPYSFTPSNYDIYLFGGNNAGSFWRGVSMCLYSLQMRNGTDVVRDFVPCADPSGVVGLYDLVHGVFYDNDGTGSFIAGPTVAVSNFTCSYCGATHTGTAPDTVCSSQNVYTCSGCDATHTGDSSGLPSSGCTVVTSYHCDACGENHGITGELPGSGCTANPSFTCTGCGTVYTGPAATRPSSGCTVITYLCSGCQEVYGGDFSGRPPDGCASVPVSYTCAGCGDTVAVDAELPALGCSATHSHYVCSCGETYSGTGSLPSTGCAVNGTSFYTCNACGKEYKVAAGEYLPDTRCYAAEPGKTLAEIASEISGKMDDLSFSAGTVTTTPTDLTPVTEHLYRIGDDISAIALALSGGGDDDSSGPCDHDYTSEDTQEPTCQLPGLRLFTCSLCSNAYSEIVSALGHDWACTDNVDGVDVYTCLRDGCGATYNDYSGTGTPDANAGETSLSAMLVKLFARAGTIAGKMVASVIDFFDRLLVGIDDLASRFNTMAEDVSTMGGEYPLWLAGFWVILPSDLQLALTFAFLCMVAGVIGKKLFFS